MTLDEFLALPEEKPALERHRLGHSYPEPRDVFGGAAYVPDVSFYRWGRIPRDASGRVADDFTEPPDIAIEIVSPGQRVNALIRRSIWYVENGVQVSMVVDPDDESVLIFRRGQQVHVAHGSGVIDLTDVLPGFDLKAEQIFAPLRLDP